MVGQVVVVFDGLEGGGFAVEAEVVDGDGGREEGLEGFFGVCGFVSFGAGRGKWKWKWGRRGLNGPSSIPSPERRMGTSAMRAGQMVCVSYS